MKNRTFCISDYYISNVPLFQVLTPKQKIWFNTIVIYKRYYENSMSNNLQLFDPWGYIIFLKYEATLEKHLMKLQKNDFVEQ